MKYITTPIYYVNDAPHIGHAFTTLAADVLARFWRLSGEEVFFLTGTDEHGAKVAEAAEKAGQSPQEFADCVAEQFQQAWKDLRIEPHGFIRTTNPKHVAFVQEFLQKLYKEDYFYKGKYRGWYCISCEEFKTDAQLGPNNTCPIHNRALIEQSEESYFFRLSDGILREKLLDEIRSGRFEINPPERKNEVVGFIQQGLKDVAISRRNVEWGIKLPWDEGHIVYVWIDALLNYLSVAEGDVFAEGKRPIWPPTIQLIGKDILRFHAVIWPALLLAANKDLPQGLWVHSYFTLDGEKLSKSRGNVITPQELIDRYDVDGARYVLLAATSPFTDSDVSLARFDAVYTSELANGWGNLVSRVQALLTQTRDGVVPAAAFEDLGLTDVLNAPFGGAIAVISSHTARLNRYIEETKPWELTDQHDPKLDTILATLAEHIFALAVRLWPLTPKSSEKILGAFGTSIDEIDYATLGKEPHVLGKTIKPIPPLFPRLA